MRYDTLKHGDIQSYNLSGRISLHIVPVLIWLLVLCCVVGLFYYSQSRFEVVGLAQGKLFHITAPCDGRLESVPVELFEEVGEGQILVTFDDEQLHAQLDTISAEIEHLMAQLIPTQEQLAVSARQREADRAADLRRFTVDLEQARLDVLQLRATMASDRILLRDLALEVQKNEKLLEKKAIAAYQLRKAKVQYQAMAEKIEEEEQHLTEAREALSRAQERRDNFSHRQVTHPSVEEALEVIRKQIDVQQRRMDEVLVQQQALTVTSPLNGMVVQIQQNGNQVVLNRPGESNLRKAGEFILAGDPILTLAEEEPTEIIAYTSENQLSQVQEGMRVELIKTTEPAQRARSQISCVGVTVERMPPRLWRNQNIPEWGRPFLIKIPPGLKLLPGEKVGIRRL